jgi:hypothetical protein
VFITVRLFGDLHSVTVLQLIAADGDDTIGLRKASATLSRSHRYIAIANGDGHLDGTVVTDDEIIQNVVMLSSLCMAALGNI